MKLLDTLEGQLVGAEIGVYLGDSAEKMLNKFDIKKFYLVDPYKQYKDYKSVSVVIWENLPTAKKRAKKRLEGYEQIVWLIERSSDAVKKIKEPLDFVYIDGNHTYKYVRDDIEMWAKKVREGGVVYGDDYCNRLPDVIKAVDEYSKKNGIDITIEGNQWGFIK